MQKRPTNKDRWLRRPSQGPVRMLITGFSRNPTMTNRPPNDGFSLLLTRYVQVNLCQTLLFLYQLTHNMSICSLNYEFSTWKFQAQNMLCTQIVLRFCFDIQNTLRTQHVLSLEFSCTEVGIQWTIFCHIVG